MERQIPRAEIDMARIPADANAGGLIFAIATIVIFLIGIPAVRVIFPAAIGLGCVIAITMHFMSREKPAARPMLLGGNGK